AIELTSAGTGDQHTFNAFTHGETNLTSGIGVKAQLDGTNRAKTEAEVNAFYTITDLLKGIGQNESLALGSVAAINQLFGSSLSWVGSLNEDEVTQQLLNEKAALSAAIAINVAVHEVEAIVGETTGVTQFPDLQTTGNIEITANLSERFQNFVEAFSEIEAETGSSTSLGIAFSYVKNSVSATVGDYAELDASGAITVASSLTYPFPVEPLEVFTGFGDRFLASPFETLIALTDGTLGFASLLFNNWVIGHSQAEDSENMNFSGSLSASAMINSSQATIGNNVKINQDASYWTADQSVDVDAKTDMKLISVAGTADVNFSLGVIGNIFKRSNPLTNTFDPLGRGAAKVAGGSLLFDFIDNTTVAEISSNTAVHVGADGALGIDVDETILRIALAQAGASTTSSSGQQSSSAYQGSAQGLYLGSTTSAGLVSDDTGGVTVAGGGDLDIDAASDITNVGIAGSMVMGSGGTSGFDVSASVNIIDRTTTAFVGAIDFDADLPAGTTSLDVGDIGIHAENSGTNVSIAIAGFVTVDTSTGVTEENTNLDLSNVDEDGDFLSNINNAKSDLTSVTEFSAGGSTTSGAVGVNVMTDGAYAHILDAGLISAEKVSITAENSTTLIAANGGATVDISTSDSSSAASNTFAGVVTLNYLDNETKAKIDRATIVSSAADVSGENEIVVAATRSGSIWSFGVALSVDNSGGSLAAAGTLSANIIFDDVVALIDSASVTSIGDVYVHSSNTAQLYAIAGAVAFTNSGFSGSGSSSYSGNTGFGGAIGYNQIANTTHAGIIGTRNTANIDVSSGAVNVVAENDNELIGIGVSAGWQSGQSSNLTGESLAGAVTVGINIISVNQDIFDNDVTSADHLLLADISDAVVTAAGDVAVLAEDNSGILAIGGALAISTSGKAFGVSIGWTQGVVNSRAAIERSSVSSTGGAVSVKALSNDTEKFGRQGKLVSASVGLALSKAGLSSLSTPAVGGAIAINGFKNNVTAEISDASQVSALGDVTVKADDTSTILAVTGGAAISLGGTGGGFAIGANYIANSITSKIDTSEVAAANVVVEATEDAEIEAFNIALEGSAKTAIGGSVSVEVITNTVTAAIDGISTIAADGNIQVAARNTADVWALTGQVGGSAQNAIGGAVLNSDIVNRTEAYIDGAADVTAGAGGAAFTDLNDVIRRGIGIEAHSEVTTFMLSAAGSASISSNAVAGAVSVPIIDQTTLAYVQAPASGSAGTITSSDDIVVLARDDFDIVSAAGSLSGTIIGNAVGVGVDVSSVTRRTSAYVGEGANLAADDSIRIEALGFDTITSVSGAGSASGDGAAVAVPIGVSVLSLTTEAYVGSDAVVFTDGTVVVSAL
ncbi:MAG: hypothetical protein AAFW74_02350, partial [Pseudomonadota bacterium]